MDWQIKQVSTDKKQFLSLLLLADEQESMIDRYLDRGDLFVMYVDEATWIAVAVITEEEKGVYELKNLAVDPAYQRKGIGRQMVDFLCRHYQQTGHTLLVVTYSHTLPGFFTENYDHPIVEDGKVLTDMIYFRKDLPKVCLVAPADRTVSLVEELVKLWEASVRATHHFLTEKDILHLTPFVEEAVRGIETLLVMYLGNRPIGFLGLSDLKIEMLFVAPDYFGNGLGRQLVEMAIEKYHVHYVDVNEQNPRAEGFYRHIGFRTFARTETDEQGNPFPILKMKLQDNKVNKMDNEKVYQMPLAKVYPLLVNKALRKGRTQAEVDEIICWLTGYTQEQLVELLEQPISYGDFFRKAPALNPNRKKIKGTICGIKVEEIQEPLMQEIRYLDKLIEELAKGKAMEKILRV